MCDHQGARLLLSLLPGPLLFDPSNVCLIDLLVLITCSLALLFVLGDMSIFHAVLLAVDRV